VDGLIAEQQMRLDASLVLGMAFVDLFALLVAQCRPRRLVCRDIFRWNHTDMDVRRIDNEEF
jgi:hypothetical protein